MDDLEKVLNEIVSTIEAIVEKQNEIIDKHNDLTVKLITANQRIEELERKVESLSFCDF